LTAVEFDRKMEDRKMGAGRASADAIDRAELHDALRQRWLEVADGSDYEEFLEETISLLWMGCRKSLAIIGKVKITDRRSRKEFKCFDATLHLVHALQRLTGRPAE
jgi:hypothetical protein